MQSQRVFDGQSLRATLFDGARDKLFVTFRQRLGQDGSFDDPKPSRRFIDEGYAHLHLQSRINDWYINEETEAFEAALTSLSHYGRRVGIGFSMGGYASVRFAPMLALNHLIVVSGQYTIDPNLVPQDRRYRRHAGGFDPALGWIEENTALQGAIVYDPVLPLDKLHAKQLKALCPNLRLVPMWGGGHPATGVIGSRKRFPRVQKQLLTGKVNDAALRRIHRECRMKSPLYWSHFSTVAERVGHSVWAEKAKAYSGHLERRAQKS